MLLHEAVDIWLSQHIPTTRESYSRPITYMMNLVGPELELDDITPANMVRYSRYILDNEGYSLKTKEKHIKTTKTFYNWCVKMDFVLKSPARVLKTPRVPRRVSREKAIADTDLEVLLAYLALDQTAEGMRNYALVRFLADTGARAGGAAGLKLFNLYVDELYAKVVEKGNKTRKVAFSEECARALRLWLLRRPNIPSFYVFISLRGKNKPLTVDYIGTILFRAVQYIKRDWGYDIKRANPHSMRHRIGHKMADDRETPRAIADALGHVSIYTAQENYVDYDFADIADKVRKHSVTGQKPKTPEEILEEKLIDFKPHIVSDENDTNLDDRFGTK